MANDLEWLEDVKRWCASGRYGERTRGDDGDSAEVPIGYEAAQPALEARHWPEAPTTDR